MADCVVRERIDAEGGLTKYEAGRLTTFMTRGRLPHQGIESIFGDSRGRLWIGTGVGMVPGDCPRASSRPGGLECLQLIALTIGYDARVLVNAKYTLHFQYRTPGQANVDHTYTFQHRHDQAIMLPSRQPSPRHEVSLVSSTTPQLIGD